MLLFCFRIFYFKLKCEIKDDHFYHVLLIQYLYILSAGRVIAKGDFGEINSTFKLAIQLTNDPFLIGIATKIMFILYIASFFTYPISR